MVLGTNANNWCGQEVDIGGMIVKNSLVYSFCMQFRDHIVMVTCLEDWFKMVHTSPSKPLHIFSVHSIPHNLSYNHQWIQDSIDRMGTTGTDIQRFEDNLSLRWLQWTYLFNGYNDGSNCMATKMTTTELSPVHAIFFTNTTTRGPRLQWRFVRGSIMGDEQQKKPEKCNSDLYWVANTYVISPIWNIYGSPNIIDPGMIE